MPFINLGSTLQKAAIVGSKSIWATGVNIFLCFGVFPGSLIKHGDFTPPS